MCDLRAQRREKIAKMIEIFDRMVRITSDRQMRLYQMDQDRMFGSVALPAWRADLCHR